MILSETVQAAVADTWMVVEAIPERLDLKRKVFGDLDRLSPEDAILASNSSSYPTSQFIEAVSRPERVANTHYYRPPEVNVVEVMSCGKTTNDVIARLLERLPAYGFLPFHVAKESVGFIYNRIWAAIKREALAVVAEGVSTPQVVDQLFQSVLGSRDGPFRIMDKVGLDVVLDIEEHYAAIRPGIPAEPRQLLKRYIEQGRLGIKTGKGFYSDYGEEAPTR